MAKIPRWQFAGLAAALVLLLAAGVLFYYAQKQRMRRDAEQDLQSIAQLKVSQIAQWRGERLADGMVLAESPLFVQEVAQWQKDPRPEVADPILTRFRALQKYYHYRDVLLVDPAGRVLLSLTKTSRLHEDAIAGLAAATTSRHCILSDLHEGPDDLPPHLDAVAPLFEGGTQGTKPIGAVVLQCDAREFLYPVIQSWPTASGSAETLLVRRDGDAVVFLNHLRHQSDTALKLRVPLTQKDAPAVMAVDGRKGIVVGKDYRGVEVLSALMAVPDSSWFMVAKVDSAEALAAWREQAFLIVALLLGLVVASAATVAVVWQRNAKVHYRALYQSEEGRRRSEERYRTTLMSIGDAVIATDAKGRVEILNPVAEILTGWSQPQAKGTLIGEVFHIVNEHTRAAVDNPVDRVLREGEIVGLANHTVLIARDGTESCIADSGAPIRNDQGEVSGAVLVFRDVTESRQLEEEREATIQMLRLLNAKNSFHELMRTATSFLHAWTGCEAVGIRLREGNDFPYYETRGFPEGFVQEENSLCVANPDGELRRDEDGNAVLECMCGNVLCGRFDPSKPFFTANGSFWTNCTTEFLATTTEADRQGRTRNRCNTAGYESLALIPLRADGQTQGLLQLNDHRKGRFTPQSIAMLEHLADSLAIALVQRRAAAALRESEERNRTTLYSIGDGVITTDTAGCVRQMNPVAETLTGWRQDQAAGKPIAEVFQIVNEETRAEVENPVHRVLREGQIVGLANHTILIDRCGIERPIADSGAPIRDEAQNILGVVLVFRDQTQERQAQRELLRLNRSLVAISECNQAMIRVQDESRLLQEICRIVHEVGGYPFVCVSMAQDDEARTVRGAAQAGADQDYLAKANVTWADTERGQGPTGTAIRTGRTSIIQDITNDPRYASWREMAMAKGFRASAAFPLIEAGRTFGALTVCSGTAHAFTEQETALLEELADDLAYGILSLRNAAMLGETEIRYQSLFENMLNGFAYCRMIFENDRPQDFVYLAVNAAFEALTGLKNVVGRKASDVIPGIRQADPGLFEVYGRVARTGVPETFETYVESLSMWFAISVYSPCKEHFVAIFDVITSRMQAQAALREASQLNQQIIASAQEGVIVYDLDLRYKVWNPYMETLSGLAAHEVLGRRPFEMFPFLHEIGITKRLERALAGETLGPLDFQFVISQTGRTGWVSESNAPLRGADGKIIGVIATVTDITERKKAEAALAEETARRRVLFEQSPDGIVILDPHDTRFLEFNTAAHQNLGYSREEFAQMSLADVDTMEALEDTKVRIADVLRDGRADFETIQRTRQGTIRNVLVTAQALDVMGRSVYHCVWRDITERKELELRLLHVQKLDAIGRLAGGVAHDFRNQLAVIKGYGEMLQRRGLVQDKGQDMVAQILKATDRSALLTGQLLAFSRKQTLDVRTVDLTELVTDISKAIPRMVGEDVQLLVVPCPRPCIVEIDPGQFQQAILNLSANARDAMPEGGQLTIQTSCGEVPDNVRQRHNDATPGEYASVMVRDTGCGMDEATVDQLFEPFFTTKEVGKGTGLGLPMVYGFVQQSGGFIDVESQSGKGSIFTLYFPLSTASPEIAAQVEHPAASLPRGAETILVVEDEEPVRTMLVESLREAGYAVLEASRIAEALRILDQSQAKIDMLITDVIMPEGSGIELARRTMHDRQEVRIIFISGYPGAELSKRGMQIDSANMLTKPCDHDVLLRKVRETLDEIRGA